MHPPEARAYTLSVLSDKLEGSESGHERGFRGAARRRMLAHSRSPTQPAYVLCCCVSCIAYLPAAVRVRCTMHAAAVIAARKRTTQWCWNHLAAMVPLNRMKRIMLALFSEAALQRQYTRQGRAAADDADSYRVGVLWESLSDCDARMDSVAVIVRPASAGCSICCCCCCHRRFQQFAVRTSPTQTATPSSGSLSSGLDMQTQRCALIAPPSEGTLGTN